MMTEQRRGKSVAITGAVFELLFTAVMLTIWLWTGSLVAMSCAWVLAAGLPLWLMAVVLFYCRELEQREEIEMAEILARGGEQATIFDSEHADELRPAAARAAAMQRWAVPTFTLVWATIHMTVGFFMFRHVWASGGSADLNSAAAGGLIAVVVSFAAFLFSRYSSGMGTQVQWHLLRATGSYMIVCAVLTACAVISLLAFTQNYRDLDRYLALLAPAVQIILAIELLLNFVLDMYRPRVAGKEQRDSFDSRLLNLLAQPGRVGHSIAETLNYQFGFEVSGTWFYKLVSKAMVPLMVLAVVILMALSSVVIVREGREAIVFHFGQLKAETLKSGLHVKWPWPVDTVQMYDTGRVYELTLGTGDGDEHHGEKRVATFVKGVELALWKQEHGARPELNFVVARQAGEGDEAPPVAVVKFIVLVRYRIENPLKFHANSNNSGGLVEAAALREMVQFCASATLTEKLGEGEADDHPRAIMTSGRGRTAGLLTRRIRHAVEAMDIGVNVTSVNSMAIHPPPEAAADYEKVLEAERERDAQRYEAQAKANEILASAAGTPAKARSLALAIRVLDELKGLQVSKGGELADLRLKYLARASNDLEEIDKDVQRQELLGDISPDTTAYRKNLLAYIKLLEGIDDTVAPDLARELASAGKTVDALFADAYGQAAIRVAAASADRWAVELAKRGDSESFGREIMAYRASPSVYKMDRFLDVWDEALPKMRKYVSAVDSNRVELRLNLEESADVMSGAFTGPNATGR